MGGEQTCFCKIGPFKITFFEQNLATDWEFWFQKSRILIYQIFKLIFFSWNLFSLRPSHLLQRTSENYGIEKKQQLEFMKLCYTLILKIYINFKSLTGFCSTIDVRKKPEFKLQTYINFKKSESVSEWLSEWVCEREISYVSSINFEQVNISTVCINKGYKNADFYYF